jgi:hypothetical protein
MRLLRTDENRKYPTAPRRKQPDAAVGCGLGLVVQCPAGKPATRFTIRELVLVTLVVAIGLGWALDSRQTRTQLEIAKSLLRQYEWNIRVHAPQIWPGSVMPALGEPPTDSLAP